MSSITRMRMFTIDIRLNIGEEKARRYLEYHEDMGSTELQKLLDNINRISNIIELQLNHRKKLHELDQSLNAGVLA